MFMGNTYFLECAVFAGVFKILDGSVCSHLSIGVAEDTVFREGQLPFSRIFSIYHRT